MATYTGRRGFERCYCIGVTRSQAIAAIKAHGCTSVDELRAVTGACGGCGSCRPELKQLIHEVRAGQASREGSKKPLAEDTAQPSCTSR